MRLSTLIKERREGTVTKAWMDYWHEVDVGNYDDSEHNDGRYHASALTGCPALLFLYMEGFPIPRKPEPKTFRIFGNGDGVHERIQVQLARAGILETAEFDETMETPIEIPEYNIGGHTDGVLNFGPKVDTGKTIRMFGKKVPVFRFKNTRNRAILEIKSINERGFAEVKKAGQPKPEHIKQANVYAHAKGVPRIIFIYENKNNQEWLEYSVNYSERLYKETVATIKLVERWRKEYRRTGELPKEMIQVAKRSGRERKPWGIYAIDLIRRRLGEEDIVTKHKRLQKIRHRVRRKNRG